MVQTLMICRTCLYAASGLLTHLHQFFGNLLGCSGYGEIGFPHYTDDPSMACVHKFIVLDSAEVGYFIFRVGAAAVSFGVAASDTSIEYIWALTCKREYGS